MEVKLVLKNMIIEMIYIAVVILYAINLHRFNQELLSQDLSALQIMNYENGTSWDFCIKAIFLLILAGLIIYFRFKKFKNQKDISDENVIASVLSIILILLCCVVIIYSISIPILQAAATVVICGILTGSMSSAK